jgi:hypothetical protein
LKVFKISYSVPLMTKSQYDEFIEKHLIGLIRSGYQQEVFSMIRAALRSRGGGGSEWFLSCLLGRYILKMLNCTFLIELKRELNKFDIILL